MDFSLNLITVAFTHATLIYTECYEQSHVQVKHEQLGKCVSLSIYSISYDIHDPSIKKG